MSTEPRYRIATATTTKDEAALTRIVPALAEVIGLNESIILMQIDFWIGTASDENFRDGRWWTWQSLKEMQRKAFPYWSKDTINRAIQRYIDDERYGKYVAEQMDFYVSLCDEQDKNRKDVRRRACHSISNMHMERHGFFKWLARQGEPIDPNDPDDFDVFIVYE